MYACESQLGSNEDSGGSATNVIIIESLSVSPAIRLR